MCVSLINRARNTMHFRLFTADKTFYTSERIRILLIKAHLVAGTVVVEVCARRDVVVYHFPVVDLRACTYNITL